MGEVFAIINMLQYFLGFGLIAGAATQTASIIIKNKRKKTDEMGTAKLGNLNDLKGLLGNDGLKISKQIQLNAKTGFEGISVIGPTGSGKSTSFFFPNLLSNSLQGSIVVTDPKGELYKLTCKYQQEVCNRKVILFNPLEPLISARYNLLENCSDTSEVSQLAALLLLNGALSIELMTGKKTGGAEWTNMATPLLTSALLYVKDLGKPFNTIEQAFRLVINTTPEDLDKLFESASSDAKLQYNIFKSVGSAGNTIGGIKITLATALKLFADNKVNSVGSETTFNGTDLRKEKTIIYVVYPERKSAYLAPFMACFFSQIIDKLLDNYTNDCYPVNFFFDEFANIGMLNNMSVNAATVRSRKIGFTVCLQSITQLIQVYGEHNALAILNNLKTKLVLPGLTDIRTLDYISTLSGTTEIKVSSTSETENKITRSFNSSTKKLFTDDEIRRLDSDELLIITQNRKPILSALNSYYSNSDYLNNIEEVDFKRFKRPSYNAIETEKLLNRIIKNKLRKEMPNEVNNEVDKSVALLGDIFK